MSLQDALINSFSSSADTRAEDIMNNKFLANRQTWTNNVIDDFMKHGTDMNMSIAKIAHANKLNNDQVSRIVEEANVGVYLQKYAQTRGQRVRRITFPLADTAKICPQNTNTSQEVTADEVTSLMTKVANAGAEYGLSPIDLSKTASTAPSYDVFTDSTINYGYNIWEKEASEKCGSAMLKSKLHARIEADKQAQMSAMRDMIHKIASIGDALIYNERAEQGAQKLFTKIASDASLQGKAQVPVIRYIHERVASLKEERFLPSNFEFELLPTDKCASEFSLGAHSLLKVASEDSTDNASLPSGVDYEKLVNLARSLTKKIDANSGKVNIDADRQ